MIIQDDNGLEHAYTIHIRCKRQKYSCVHFLCSIKSTALLWPWCPRDTVPPPPHPEMYSTFLPERRPCHNIQCTEFKNTLSFDATIETFQVFVWKLGRNFLWNRTVLPCRPSVPYVSSFTGAFSSLDRTDINLLAIRWVIPRQHKNMVDGIEPSILWDRTQKTPNIQL